MDKIVSRWEKKSLSQIIKLLTGVAIVILLINHFTVINIQLDFFAFISVEYGDLHENIMWIFTLFLFTKPIFELIRYVVRKCFSSYIAENEITYYKVLAVSHAIEDILELAASVYGLLFIFIVYSFRTDYGVVYDTMLAKVTFLGVSLRVFDSVFFHFYLSHLAIINKALKKD